MNKARLAPLLETEEDSDEEETITNPEEEKEEKEAPITKLIQQKHKHLKDLEIMDEYFQNIKFFKECKKVLTKERYYRILKAIEYESVKKNQFLFHRGERGNKFYVLLNGQAIVVIPRAPGENVEISKAYHKFISKILYERVAEPRQSSVVAPLQSRAFLERMASMAMIKGQQKRKSITKRTLRRGATVAVEPLVSAEEIAKRKREELRKRVIEFRAARKPKKKCKRSFAIFGYWLVKTWMNKYGGEQHGSLAARDLYRVFSLYRKKRFWHNMLLHHLGTLDLEFMDKLFPRLKRVHQYTAGGYFGELAIMEGGIRKAGIYCSEDTEFAVLTKKDETENDFLFLYNAQHKEQEKLIKSFRCFNYWIANDTVRTLFHYFKEVKRGAKAVIYKKGTPTDGIYLLAEGDIEIALERKVKNTNMMTNDSRLRKDHTHHYKRILTAPHIFGVEEMLLKYQARLFQARVTSTSCRYLFLPKQEYSCLDNPNLPKGIALKDTNISEMAYMKSLIDKGKEEVMDDVVDQGYFLQRKNSQNFNFMKLTEDNLQMRHEKREREKKNMLGKYEKKIIRQKKSDSARKKELDEKSEYILEINRMIDEQQGIRSQYQNYAQSDYVKKKFALKHSKEFKRNKIKSERAKKSKMSLASYSEFGKMSKFNEGIRSLVTVLNNKSNKDQNTKHIFMNAYKSKTHKKKKKMRERTSSFQLHTRKRENQRSLLYSPVSKKKKIYSSFKIDLDPVEIEDEGYIESPRKEMSRTSTAKMGGIFHDFYGPEDDHKSKRHGSFRLGGTEDSRKSKHNKTVIFHNKSSKLYKTPKKISNSEKLNPAYSSSIAADFISSQPYVSEYIIETHQSEKIEEKKLPKTQRKMPKEHPFASYRMAVTKKELKEGEKSIKKILETEKKSSVLSVYDMKQDWKSRMKDQFSTLIALNLHNKFNMKVIAKEDKKDDYKLQVELSRKQGHRRSEKVSTSQSFFPKVKKKQMRSSRKNAKEEGKNDEKFKFRKTISTRRRSDNGLSRSILVKSVPTFNRYASNATKSTRYGNFTELFGN